MMRDMNQPINQAISPSINQDIVKPCNKLLHLGKLTFGERNRTCFCKWSEAECVFKGCGFL